ncbi:MAG: hypothetical protein CVU39_25550 [Chloroflexi bacterium HGW-Chloroflexi-10]|nr:MAG: hypothetical protein CVU39_25550 [Chloroflexi bacterium HGW-Chloroflexi-10]
MSKLILRGTGSIFFAAAIILMVIAYQKSQSVPCVFPQDYNIAGVDVSGLSPEQAADMLNSTYSMSYTLRIGKQTIFILPEDLGYQLKSEEMVNKAAANCSQLTGWTGFWQYIWQKNVSFPVFEEIIFEEDAEKVREVLRELVEGRYQIPAGSAYPIPNTTQYFMPSDGSLVDTQAAVSQILGSYKTPSQREITLEIQPMPAKGPDLTQIEYQLKQIIQQEGYPGIVEVFVERISDGEKINFALTSGADIEPGIAFTAASTMKIPIMVSTFWRDDLPLSELKDGWIRYMIKLSENDPADRLMEALDPVRGPLLVSEDLQLLGYENTFIAGYFAFGSPLLDVYQTPANSRQDIHLKPDLYNQTTPADIGRLLADLAYCASGKQGNLGSPSGGNIQQAECQYMLDILAENKIGALIEAGVADGTRVAHKHGWSEEQDGLLHTVSDVAVVSGPENEYVITVFVYSHSQLFFENANYLVAKLSQAVFNGMNPHHQIEWQFD